MNANVNESLLQGGTQAVLQQSKIVVNGHVLIRRAEGPVGVSILPIEVAYSGCRHFFLGVPLEGPTVEKFLTRVTKKSPLGKRLPNDNS